MRETARTTDGFSWNGSSSTIPTDDFGYGGRSAPFDLILAERRLMADSSPRTTNQLVAFVSAPVRKPSKSVSIEMLPLERAREFQMPGPALTRVVYVRHPSSESELIPFADYDERLARDRYQEALRVFTKLGAARIVATTHSQTTKRNDARLGMRGVTLSVGRQRDAAWSLAADLEGDGSRPVDPRPLRFDDIAGLDAVCEGVLHNGWRKGKIRITQSSTLRVDGELAGALKKAGFSLGLSGGRAKAAEFLIEAAFTPEAAKALDAVVEATDSVPSRRLGRPKVRDRQT